MSCLTGTGFSKIRKNFDKNGGVEHHNNDFSCLFQWFSNLPDTCCYMVTFVTAAGVRYHAIQVPRIG